MADLPTLLWCPACEGGWALERVLLYTKNLPGDRLCYCCMTVWHKGSVPSEFFDFEVAAQPVAAPESGMLDQYVTPEVLREAAKAEAEIVAARVGEDRICSAPRCFLDATNWNNSGRGWCDGHNPEWEARVCRWCAKCSRCGVFVHADVQVNEQHDCPLKKS